jgi:hypothetical protein
MCIRDKKPKLPVMCGQLVLCPKTLPLSRIVDQFSTFLELEWVASDEWAYETHNPSIKIRISKSKASSGCIKLSIRRLGRGLSQL